MNARHHERGGDALAGDVSDQQGHTSLAQGKRIDAIAADLARHPTRHRGQPRGDCADAFGVGARPTRRFFWEIYAKWLS